MKEIKRKFLDGMLKGLIYTGQTMVNFKLNEIYTDSLTGDKYQIIEIKEVK